MKKALYICPSKLSHAGIAHKVRSQVTALKTILPISLITLPLKSPHRIRNYVAFHRRAVIAALKANWVYCRYNPKVPFLNATLVFLSFFKPVFFELNAFYDRELKALNRNAERLLHVFSMIFLRRSRSHFFLVHRQLKTVLKKQGVPETRCHLLHNAYLQPVIDPSNVDFMHVNTVKTLKKDYKKLGIFVGSQNLAHGLSHIRQFMQRHPRVFFILIGDFSWQDMDNTLHLGSLNLDTLLSIYPHCSFAVGSMGWDRLQVDDACPLKTAEYLSHGLPVLIRGYRDWAMDIPELAPFILDIESNPKAETGFIRKRWDRDTLKKASLAQLNWVSFSTQTRRLL